MLGGGVRYKTLGDDFLGDADESVRLKSAGIVSLPKRNLPDEGTKSQIVSLVRHEPV